MYVNIVCKNSYKFLKIKIRNPQKTWTYFLNFFFNPQISNLHMYKLYQITRYYWMPRYDVNVASSPLWILTANVHLWYMVRGRDWARVARCTTEGWPFVNLLDWIEGSLDFYSDIHQLVTCEVCFVVNGIIILWIFSKRMEPWYNSGRQW